MDPRRSDAPAGASDRLPGTAYVLLRRLGSGSMGEVYEARHEPLDCLRALKLLWPEHSADSQSARRLRIEARTLASLRHPNLVDVVDFGESEGRCFLAMSLLDGETVGAALLARRRFAPSEAVFIASELLEGLHAAHAIGLVHRDVKPENAFLCTDGVVKLLDFGIAKVKDGTITAHGHTVGTPRYMAPEQILGREVDARTDVYAMGVMLFELLAGRPPFVDAEPITLAYAHVKRPVPSLASLAPETPAGLVRAVERALRKNAGDRFPSARAFAEALRAAVPPEAPRAHGAGVQEGDAPSIPRPTIDPTVVTGLRISRTAATRTGTRAHAAVVAPSSPAPASRSTRPPPSVSPEPRPSIPPWKHEPLPSTDTPAALSTRRAPARGLEPLVRGSVLHAFQVVTREMFGAEGLADVAERLPEDTRRACMEDIVLPVSWYPVRHVMAFQEALLAGPVAGDAETFRTLIHGTVALGVGRSRKLFFETTPPRLVIAGCARIWRDQYTTGDLTPADITANGCRIELRNHPFTSTPLARLAATQVLRHTLTLTRLRGVEDAHHADASGTLVMRFTWK